MALALDHRYLILVLLRSPKIVAKMIKATVIIEPRCSCLFVAQKFSSSFSKSRNSIFFFVTRSLYSAKNSRASGWNVSHGGLVMMASNPPSLI